MGGRISRISRTSLFCATALASLGATPTLAQDVSASSQGGASGSATGEANEIIVTGNHRSTTLQDAPINISAVSQDKIQDQRIDDIRSLASFVPGVTVQDTGPSSSGDIVLRGLSTGGSAASAVGVYLGEVPLYLDFKLIDLSRVEVLQGPQGTLYGLGTLAGAVRYIPNRPTVDRFSVEVHGRGYSESHSSDFGGIGDITVNIPIVQDHIAFRTATGYYDNAGFIDYDYILRQPGISDPQPVRATATSTGSFGTPAQIGANFRRKADANYEHTFTTRNQLLLEYNPNIKAYLTYAHQTTKTDGRQANGAGVLGTANYVAPWRYEEPSYRQSDLLSAEAYINLFNIAQMVSTTAFTKQNAHSTGDNTDLLLDLNYGYEAFPEFSSYANNQSRTAQFEQEVRFVSTHGGPFSWVVGGFYNRQNFSSGRQEYTPGYAQYFGINRPDNLEYISQVNTQNTEKAVYGEGTLHVTKRWQVTGGIRYFHYDANVSGGSALPLLGSGIGAYPSITINANRFRTGDTGKSGAVWKANTSYKFNDNLLGYFTYSTGYRVGGVNRVVPCILPLKPGQNLCALPNELSFGPDKTRNMEVGVRGSLFDKRVQFTLDAYHINWNGVQVPSQTVNGAIGITVNGATAISQGMDASATVKITPNLSVSGTYSYVDAHLTAFAPGILVSQGVLYDGQKGDRLPGSQKNSGSAQLNYSYPLGGGRKIEANWAAVYHGDIDSKLGLRANGESIPSYVTHSASVNFVNKMFDVGLFADNIFDKYAVTAISNDISSFNQVRTNVVERYYAHSVLTPRRVGVDLRVRY
jgi:outer membrane receptor protein involved in Fe transport